MNGIILGRKLAVVALLTLVLTGIPMFTSTTQAEENAISGSADTPFGKHGKLRLEKADGFGNAPVIVDQTGQPFQLRGVCTHGLQWDCGKTFVNKETFQKLRDEWGINLVRLACYVTQGGYTQGAKDSMDSLVQNAVSDATDLGMYVIIDWHVHEPGDGQVNPNTWKGDAEQFFTKFATQYKDYDNVIFEVCNEPIKTEWYDGSGNDLYTYCSEMTKVIRDCGSDALVVCGTNTWSQDVDRVSEHRIDDDRVLYTLHFYAATHYDDVQKKMTDAIEAGTPVFVTEFGICSASGQAPFDEANADKWIELCDKNNVSFACWSMSNKDEGASYFVPSCSRTSGNWDESDIATTGKWFRDVCLKHEAEEESRTPAEAEEAPQQEAELSDADTKEPAVTKAEVKAPNSFLGRIINWFRNLFGN